MVVQFLTLVEATEKNQGLHTYYYEYVPLSQHALVLLGLLSRAGDKPLTFQLVRPQDGTALLKYLINAQQYSTRRIGLHSRCGKKKKTLVIRVRISGVHT